jgi:hypothetical protein
VSSTNQSGDYYVQVSDDSGTNYSDDAYLTVNTSIVSFLDPNLEAAVLSALGLNSGPITYDEMLTLTSLTADNAGITNLTGLDLAQNLASLELNQNTLNNPGILVFMAFNR